MIRYLRNCLLDSYYQDNVSYKLFLPIYRDDETRADYESVANFFYCMDACDTRYMVKRMTLALPIVALGKCGPGCRILQPWNFQPYLEQLQKFDSSALLKNILCK